MNALNAPPADRVATLDAVFGCLPHGLCQFDDEGRVILANKQFQRLYAVPDEAVASGAYRTDLLAAVERTDARRVLAEVTANPRGFGLSEPAMWDRDGEPIAVTCEPLPGGGCVSLHEVNTSTTSDVLLRQSVAPQDPLTGLLNRPAFNEQVALVLSQSGATSDHALLYFDLDRFKPVNDTLGHPVGDRVLKAVADRVRGIIRPEDLLARLGGDEFALLQVGAPQPSASRSLARRIIEVVSQPLTIDGHTVELGASVGVAITPFDGEDADELLKNSDLAMYKAKHDGRNTMRYFEPEMNERLVARRRLEHELRTAIDQEQFQMLYQPVMDVDSESFVSVEGLIRWRHPELGCVSPDDFIPLAEETGLIVPLGEWALRQACRDAAGWDNGVGVAVNVSPAQLRSRMFPAMVREVLAETGLTPSRLELEITETALVADTELTIAILTEVRNLGVKIAMDDFGTGYSSISYLRRFPFDKIKIDRSFVTGAATNAENAALVRMIAALGESLTVATTAEGVESIGEMDMVREAGCSQIQGYLLSKPVDEVTLSKLIKNPTSQRKDS